MPAAKPELTLGVALREAREAAGLTVEQVSADTRIRATLVRDLEADRFASSGGSVYARGHVKSIASTLRIDAAPLLALFDQAEGSAPVEALLTQPEAVVTTLGGSDFAAAKTASLRPDRRGPRWGVALTGAAAVLIALIGIGSLGGGSGGRSPTALGASPSATPEVSQPTVHATVPPDSTANKPPVTGAQLRVRVIGGKSWVSISNAGGQTLFEGTLGDGQFKDFRDAAKLKVIVGNPPVVSLNCNGRDSGPVAPNSRKVGHFSCTPTGLSST
ncbi:MAG: rane protein [Bryobacterales bacterium]|nr:rane protein [Bryobacterales bacterium]